MVEHSMRGALHELVNLAPVRRMLTGQRWLVRGFFDWKYRREDPYGSRSSGCREKYAHGFSMVADLQCERAVEVGCGEGLNAERIARFSGSYLGLDISPRAIRRARESVRAPNAEFRVFDLVGDDFEGSHDYLFCSEVLYYLLLEELPGAVAKIVEATRPGGVIHLLHCRSIRDDSSGLALKEFGAKTVHEAFLRCGALVRLADEETTEYRVTVLQKA